jgi:hypothetical protein
VDHRKIAIKGVPKEIPTVPTVAKLEPPDPAPTGEALTRELTSAPTREPPGDPLAPIREPTLAPTMKSLALPSTRKATSAPGQEPLALISTNLQSGWNTALTPTKGQSSLTREPLAPTIQPLDSCKNNTPPVFSEPPFHPTDQLPPVPTRELLLLHSTRELPSVPTRELPTAPAMEHPNSSAQALSLGPPRETPQSLVYPPMSHYTLLAPTPNLQCPLPVDLVWPIAIFPIIKAEFLLTMSSRFHRQKTLNPDLSLISCPDLQLANFP